jgi:predicted tellurium resistance membrane protein TerC
MLILNSIAVKCLFKNFVKIQKFLQNNYNTFFSESKTFIVIKMFILCPLSIFFIFQLKKQIMDWLTNTDIWVSFFTLCALEIVLGIDNLIFISILTNKLPEEKQKKARQLGLSLALVMRISLLFSISWIMSLKNDLFELGTVGISGRDIILILGGLFLIYKSVKEIHEKVEAADGTEPEVLEKATFNAVIAQIIVIDMVFSLDSVITAVGMTDYIGVMIAAVIVSMIVMMLSADALSSFVNRHPAVKILALAFLIMIGIALIAEGLDFHIPKGYIYFSMAFAVVVEFINISTDTRKKR